MVNYEMDTQVKAQVAQHLEECMEDTGLYRWERVRAFHAACLNQLEQSRSTWGDVNQKMPMCRTLVWHTAMATHAASHITLVQELEKRLPSNPGASQKHPEWQYICSYCLTTIHRAFHHSEISCNRKRLAQETISNTVHASITYFTI